MFITPSFTRMNTFVFAVSVRLQPFIGRIVNRYFPANLAKDSAKLKVVFA